MKTFVPKINELEESWYLVDADNAVLGRLASQIAAMLRGKHRADFTPHMNLRDHIVVINAEKVQLTGKKLIDKKYYKHTGYPGGIKETNAQRLLEKKPEELIRRAVWGMVPHNKLGRASMKRLRIFSGAEHNHQAQKPEAIDLESFVGGKTD